MPDTALMVATAAAGASIIATATGQSGSLGQCCDMLQVSGDETYNGWHWSPGYTDQTRYLVIGAQGAYRLIPGELANGRPVWAEENRSDNLADRSHHHHLHHHQLVDGEVWILGPDDDFTGSAPTTGAYVASTTSCPEAASNRGQWIVWAQRTLQTTGGGGWRPWPSFAVTCVGTSPPTNPPPTNPPTSPPTSPPTNPPTSPPTNPPTQSPATEAPTAPPTRLTTTPSTAPPTAPPTQPPPDRGTTLNPTTVTVTFNFNPTTMPPIPSDSSTASALTIRMPPALSMAPAAATSKNGIGFTSGADGSGSDGAAWAVPVAIASSALVAILVAGILVTRVRRKPSLPADEKHGGSPSGGRSAAVSCMNPTFVAAPGHDVVVTMQATHPALRADPEYSAPDASAGVPDHPGRNRDVCGYVEGHQATVDRMVYEAPVPVPVGGPADGGFLSAIGAEARGQPRPAAGNNDKAKRGIKARKDRKSSQYDGFGDAAAAVYNYGGGHGTAGGRRLCCYVARDGMQCRNDAATWSNRCTKHTCDHPRCSQPKSSQVTHCAEHAGGASEV